MRNGSIIIAEHLKQYEEAALHNCEVHLNLWKNATRKKFRLNVEYLLDIGIKIFKYENTIESLIFFFPFQMEKYKVRDLGGILSDSKSLVNVIFNESLIHTDGEENQGSISKFESKAKDEEKKKKRSFHLYTLAPNNYDVERKEGLEGTFLKINLQGAELSEPNKLYDIRINDRRETDDKVLEEIETTMHNTLMPICKAHFFFITNVVDHVSNGNSERMDTRMLEMDKWESYAPYEDDHPRIAYHWKKVAEKDNTFENFEIFFRNTCDNRNYHKILLYLFVAFWIGAVGSSIASIGLNLQCVPWIGYGLVVLMTIIIGLYYWLRKL